jgi:3-carboxy-cis,cis-muconate cycloisomerase
MAGVVHGAALHRQGRDGAAWMTERLALPQVLAVTGGALARAGEMVAGLAPNPAAMARNMVAGGGAIHAEALAFALARRMPLAQAQAEVGALVAQAGERTLAELVRERHPGLGWTGPTSGRPPPRRGPSRRRPARPEPPPEAGGPRTACYEGPACSMRREWR